MTSLAPRCILILGKRWRRQLAEQKEHRDGEDCWVKAIDIIENQGRNMDAKQITSTGETTELWPLLPYEAWKETLDTLHMWTQIVGKVRMELSPFANHWWHVTFYVTARGLTTSPIPSQDNTFEVDFYFLYHNLFIQTSEGTSKSMPLLPRSVPDFYL